MLDAALLGTGGMMPLPDRFLTSMLLKLNGRGMLIDCGEGTQVTLKLLGWGFKNIDVICITHFHADHVSGLPGILLAIGNSDRREPMTIIGPAGLAAVYRGLMVIAPELPYDVNIIELDGNEKNMRISEFSISALKVQHRITCLAYSIYVHRAGRFDVERATANNVPREVWSRLQKENTVAYNGAVYTPDMVLGEVRNGIKFSYCTDTRPTEELPEFVHNSDLFVCEGMYGEDEKKEKAMEKKHMIFSEAAEIARRAEVKELWLTHFSPALSAPEQFTNNARRIFPNTIIGHDRLKKKLMFE